MRERMGPARGAGVVAAMVLACAPPVAAEEAGELQIQIELLRRQMEETNAAYQRQIEALSQRIQELEAQAAAPPAPAPSTAGMFGGPDVGFGVGLTMDASAGGSSAPDRVLYNGETGLEGGSHDPHQNGFTLQAAELALSGVVDPYFDAQATVLFQIDQDGETVVELEEAFATTRFLPGGLQLRAGQFYSPFGRGNSVHVHAMDFVDQPFILTRMFGGDGQRQVGTQLSWLTPLPWYSEVIGAAQNSNGETMPSFGGEDEGIAGFENVISQQRGFDDLVYTTRWVNGIDLSDSTSMNLGASASFGPNRTGPDNRTVIAGGDVYVKWVDPYATRGFPFASLETEYLSRWYQAGDVQDSDRTDLRDWGFYAQGLWGFMPDWVAGLRFGYGNGNMGSDDSVDNVDDINRSQRWRISPNLTWYPTEFSKVRLQYNHDWAQALPNMGASDGVDPTTGTYGRHSADSVWLQVGIALGAHGAHEF